MSSLYLPPRTILARRLPNVGREQHTYLTHVISNYHTFREMPGQRILFTATSMEKHNRNQTLTNLLRIAGLEVCVGCKVPTVVGCNATRSNGPLMKP